MNGSLTAEFALGTDFTSDTRGFGGSENSIHRVQWTRHSPSDFSGEDAQTLGHAVDGLLELDNFALDVDVDSLSQITLGDGCRDGRDTSDLGGKTESLCRYSISRCPLQENG